MNPPRPRPKLDDVNRPFWTGGKDGVLNITHCPDCGEYTHPPLPLCRHCQSENIAPKAVPGTGVVDTFTVNYQPWAQGLEVPLVIARIRLDEVPGVFITSNVVNSPVDDVAIDDRVAVTFSEEDGIWYPLFEKVA